MNLPPIILLNNGRDLDLLNPDLTGLKVEHLAASLSKLCRFNGHCNGFYSVAQHSVLVSEICPHEFALHGLLHDAHEAFIGDITTPLKHQLTGLEEIENRLQRAVFEHFGLSPELPPEVKHADHVALKTEERDLMPEHTPWGFYNGIVSLSRKLSFGAPSYAQDLFLNRFYELTGR